MDLENISNSTLFPEKNYKNEAENELTNQYRIFNDGVKDIHICNMLYEQHGEKIFKMFDEYGNSVLHWAALHGDLSVIAMVVAAGKTLNPKDLNESTIVNLNIISKNNSLSHPIHWACDVGNIHVVELFLRLGVDINVLDSKRYTPQMIAIQKNHVLLAIYLTSKGADINHVDSSGDNCLHWSAYMGNVSLVKYLIEANNMNPFIKDNYNQNCLHLACLNGNVELIKFLIERMKMDYLECDNSDQNCIDILKYKKHVKALDYFEKFSQSFKKQVTIAHPAEYVPISEVYSINDFLYYIKTTLRNKNKKLGSLLSTYSAVEAISLASKSFFWLNCVISFCALIDFANRWRLEFPFYVFYTFNYISVVLFFIKVSKVNKNTSYLNDMSSYKQTMNQILSKDDYAIQIIEIPQLCHKCCVVQSAYTEHCIICDKCIMEMMFHEFTFGKCITRNTLGIYFAFVFHRSILFVTMAIAFFLDWEPWYGYFHWFFFCYLIGCAISFTYSLLAMVVLLLGGTVFKMVTSD